VTTRWTGTLYSLYETVGRSLYAARTAGKVAGYGFGSDTAEEPTCLYIWRSGWQDFNQWQVGDRYKLMKRLGGQFVANPAQTITFKWWTDFVLDSSFSSVQLTAGGSTAAEFNIAQFNIDQFGGGIAQFQLTYDARGAAQYYKFGFEANVNTTFAVQQAQLFAKTGRLIA
jgi:hypothetical protein